MIPDTIYPWQSQQWDMLSASKEQKRLPHALLLAGHQGLGKRQFALTWAKTLLCNKSHIACGQCHSCHLIQAQSHSDLLLVEPEQAGGIIKIDQVREVIQFVSETALQGHHRVVVIHPANAMNINAANALLKTLEEPAPNTTLILISDQSLRLPATLLSRCQKILFRKPSASMSLEWLKTAVGSDYENKDDSFSIVLKLAEGSPLKAKENLENGFFELRQTFYQNLTLLSQQKADPLQLALHYQEHDVRLLLTLLLIWTQDLLRFQLTQGQAELVNHDYHAVFARLAGTLATQSLLQYQDQVKKTYSYLLSSLNLNRQLLLEEIFIDWVNYAS